MSYLDQYDDANAGGRRHRGTAAPVPATIIVVIAIVSSILASDSNSIVTSATETATKANTERTSVFYTAHRTTENSHNLDTMYVTTV